MELSDYSSPVTVISPAWYHAPRLQFLSQASEEIADVLAGRAAAAALETGPEQYSEWKASVDLLKEPLTGDGPEEQSRRVRLIREAVAGIETVSDVILEFDFRRRGLRMDCLLLCEGALFVIEFKRNRLTASDRDQVMNYAVNLLEFHKVTRQWAREECIIVPMLVLTQGAGKLRSSFPGFAPHPWSAIAARPLACNGSSGLRDTLLSALEHRRSRAIRSRRDWLNSPFSPSSTIIDAALSLYGQHDVAAIEEHAAPKQVIADATAEIAAVIEGTLKAGEHCVVFLSGAPGSGKTLVGLNLAFHQRLGADTAFVTGNSPLVEVLHEALKNSYRRRGKSGSRVLSGYPKDGFRPLVAASTFKIVKAHQFLGKRGQAHGQEDGRVVVFDEAQRTYKKDTQVAGHRLEDHEADLILTAQRKQFPSGSVVVALIGHQQAINRTEQGMLAWFDAAERQGWRVAVGDETLSLLPKHEREKWSAKRTRLEYGHLKQSMRFYRNEAVERWAGALLEGTPQQAAEMARCLDMADCTIWLTRDLEQARKWARGLAVGGQRAGLIASGQARRLAAYGLFVDHKPSIADWMLAPSGDFRSSNALETVQNQYQVQGLELDFVVTCWDLDLRRQGDSWAAFRLNGPAWQRDNALEIARNSYRVLLTRARKGMIIFVPRGDESGEDETRPADEYDAVVQYLLACGAQMLPGE